MKMTNRQGFLVVLVLFFCVLFGAVTTPAPWAAEVDLTATTSEPLPVSFTSANQATVAWDPVTFSTYSVAYVVYYRLIGFDGGFLGEPVVVGETSAASYSITFPDQGLYIVGVQSKVVDSPEVLAEKMKSTISWSNIPSNCFNGETFGIIYIDLTMPSGLRREQ